MGIQGKPVGGNVCMDMTMVDVSHIPEVAEGDEVVVFGEANPIYEMAAQAGTIPYEILTNTSERVKRVFCGKASKTSAATQVLFQITVGHTLIGGLFSSSGRSFSFGASF